mgnify:CR=1 FL=1
MKILNVKKVTADSLASNEFLESIPEVYSLRNTIENNSWHIKHNLFDHTVRVLKNLDRILSLKSIDNHIKEVVRKSINNKIDKHSRKDLLRITAILHDIGKPISLTEDSSGITYCTAHEVIGASLISNFSKRFLLSKCEESYVKRLVEYHSLIIDIQTQIIAKGKKNYYFNIYNDLIGNLRLELLLLHYADLMASDPDKTNPEEFRLRKRLTMECFG